ncbi:MAG: phosphatidate cytidylyltransferase [Acidimicrobiaceae bacterium]|nr:phosphatidate cytidylyltransferase [Ilumatobacter sp.]MCB9382238.1 phosphatidate cytidylyltransferase [Acidimicrobiaceae bacterium]MCO5329464.1 phosphatidate cytidylyltransferase [Ilumatobacteraceae bacterium]
MTDDQWRRRRDEEEDFGPPLFSDDSGDVSGGLSFGDGDTGPLPHWTEPATGEIPRTFGDHGAADPTDDLDVWSSFSGQQPVWNEPDPSDSLDDITGLSPVFESPEPEVFEEPAPTNRDESLGARREPGRITIGTDPTDGMSARPTPSGRRGRPGDARGGRGGRPAPPPRAAAPGAKPAKGTGGRDMPTAIMVGAAIATVFILAVKWRPFAVAIIVVVVLGLAAVEFFDRVREKGYQPAFIPGIAACIAAPAAVYNYGVGSLGLVAFLTFLAIAVTFIFGGSLDSSPMPNMAISMLGVAWIGILGSFGAGIVGWSTFGGNLGTDTITLLAIAVVANDVGALFVGSAVGRTPLREWISPNKSIEGFVGGTILTLGAMFVVGLTEKSTTWTSTGDLLLLGLVVAITAPIGDLTESMFKRNLDVKDFGSIIKGHGGVLDRFDGFLIALPAVYYLTIYLNT